jgi:uncharacterized repeat protein (TIGR01451 family)
MKENFSFRRSFTIHLGQLRKCTIVHFSPAKSSMRALLLVLLLLANKLIFAQVNMSNGTYSVTGTSNFYDSGGSGANYANNLSLVATYNPTVAGEKVSFYLTSEAIENNFDYLYVYNGNSTSAPLVATITGINLWNGYHFTSTASNGALTFRFTSDNATTKSGWIANLSTTLVSGSDACATAKKVCPSATLTYVTDPLSTVPGGNNYGCLGTPKAPSWFYIKMATAGTANIALSASADLDYALWGPFSSVAAATAACGAMPAPVACGFNNGTTEAIGVPTSTAGQIYVLLISNFAGGFQTFTLNQTSGTGTIDCNGLPGFCGINAVTASNLTTCNNNGTPSNGADDYYTADIMVDFANKPATGTLNLTGSVIGTYSIPVGTAISPYTFLAVHIPANGSATTLNASFSANTSCSNSLNLSPVANCAPVPGPGGQITNLQVWLKADSEAFSDAGATNAVNNSTVQQWGDQTTNNNNLDNVTAAQRPTFLANGLNFNPILRFNAGHFLAKVTPTLGAIGSGAKEYFAVTTNVTNTAQGTVLNFSTNPQAAGTNLAYGVANNIGTGVFTNSYQTLRTLANSGSVAAPHVYNTNSASGAMSTWTYLSDGLATGSATNTGTDATPNVSIANMAVGARFSTSGSVGSLLAGDIAEIVFYNAQQTNRDRVQTYLAIKYGITLGSTATLVDYKNSAGTTVWTGDATYQNNITGIGRDDISCLNQKQSKSVNAAGIVTVGHGGILATNAANTTAFPLDKTALIFGDNAAATTFLTPVSGEVATNQMARIWKTVQTNTVGGTKFSLPASYFTAGSTPYIYISSDATFTNTDEKIEMTLNGANYEASPLLMSRAGTTYYFTFAQKTILPVTLTLAMTGSAATVASGNPLSYQLTVTNTSANTAYNVKVKDQLPAGVTLGTVTPPSGTTWDAATRTWTITSLAGSNATISLTIPTTVQ